MRQNDGRSAGAEIADDIQCGFFLHPICLSLPSLKTLKKGAIAWMIRPPFDKTLGATPVRIVKYSAFRGFYNSLADGQRKKSSFVRATTTISINVTQAS
jgi:hypothetical protein